MCSDISQKLRRAEIFHFNMGAADSPEMSLPTYLATLRDISEDCNISQNFIAKAHTN
jgi:hypothetical protein